MSFMGEPKPFASLSSGLLARKGAARPAMRRQSLDQPFTDGFSAEDRLPNAQEGAEPALADTLGCDDLGWNDMGYDVDPVADDAAPDYGNLLAGAIPETQPADNGSNAVDDQNAGADRADLADAVPWEAPGLPEAVPLADVGRSDVRLQQLALAAHMAAPVPKPGRRAAFTLRLDSDRHLRLRLASAVSGQSAQQLLTAALDEMLTKIPEIDAMAGRVSRTAKR